MRATSMLEAPGPSRYGGRPAHRPTIQLDVQWVADITPEPSADFPRMRSSYPNAGEGQGAISVERGASWWLPSECGG